MKKSVGIFLLISLLLVLPFIFASPILNFVTPTPDNEANFSSGYPIEINVSINEPNLTQVVWNWNSNNYSFYDSTLVYSSDLNGNANDESLYGNDGTITGASSTTGKYNGAYHFDGSGDGISLGDIEVDSWTDLTLSAWIKTSTTSGSMRVIVKDQVGVAGNFLLWWSAGSSWKMQAWDTSDSAWSLAEWTSTSINDGNWHYLTGVVDNSNNEIVLYVDGVEKASDSFGATTLDDSDSEEIVIGGDSDVGSYEHVFNGDIDEVRIYNRSFSSSEVLQEYYSNLDKLDNNSWNFYSQQSGLSDGNYTYSLYAFGTEGNSTEERLVIIGNGSNYSEPPPEVNVSNYTSDLIIWAVGDPHVQTDDPAYLSYESAINDTLYGGDQGGEAFNWTININTGDYTGDQQCPGDSDGQDVLDQIHGSGIDPNLFYGVSGNHDGTTNMTWFKRWVDPLGQSTATSEINQSLRPYVTRGSWENYYFEIGNILFLMISDRNEPDGGPFGRQCTGGYPSGRVFNDTYNWWVDMVEANPDKIIFTVFHQALLNTTTYTNFHEGYDNGVHGGHSWADKNGSSMLYAIDNWTIDGLDENFNYIGERPYGFRKYLEDHPGAIDFWIHGHTHKNMYPGKVFNGNKDIMTKMNVTFVNTGGLTKAHGGAAAPSSRVFYFNNDSNTVTIRTYLHSNEWAGNPEGFYDPVEETIALPKQFTYGYLIANSSVDAVSEDLLEDYSEDRKFGLQDSGVAVDGIIVANFTLNFSSDRDWSDISAGINSTEGKSFAHLNLGSHPEIVSNEFTLRIPVVSDSGEVFICPNATSLDDVNGTCPNKYSIGGLTSQNGYYYVSVSGSGGGESNPPVLNYVSPTLADGVITNNNYIEVNVSADDDDLDTVTIEVFDENNTKVNESVSSVGHYASFQLTDGLYYYNASANDSLGNEASLTTRNITVLNTSVDTEAPVITGTSPSNGGSGGSINVPAGTTNLTINVTTDENSTCKFTNDSSEDWDNMTDFGITGGFIHSFDAGQFQDGFSYTYYILCEDTSENRMAEFYNYTINVLSLSSGLPEIQFISPTPSDNENLSVGSDVTINLSITEENLSEFIFNWNGSNISYYDNSLNAMINFDNLSSLGESDSFVRDLSPYSNDGAVTGAVPVSSGIYGGAYNFDGSGDGINLGYMDIDSWEDLTVSAWIKTTTTTGSMRVVVKDQVGIQGNFLLFFVNGIWKFEAWDTSDSAWSIAEWTSTSINDGNWHYLTGVVDNSANLVRLYVDGVERGSDTFSASTLDDSDSEEIVIGGDSDVGSYEQVFNGDIDEVRIYNRTLSVEEILQQYNSNLNKLDSDSWLFFSQQNNLSEANYTYQGFVSDVELNNNATENRNLILGQENSSSSDTTPPVIQSIYATINITTDEQAVCKHNSTDTDWNNMVEFSITNSTEHLLFLFDLIDGNKYNHYILCEDSYGNRMTNSSFVQIDLNKTSN